MGEKEDRFMEVTAALEVRKRWNIEFKCNFDKKGSSMDDMSQSGKKMRLLTVALIVSGALNIGLVATGLFTKTQEVDPKVSIRPVNLEGKYLDTGIERCLSQMEKLSFHELVSFFNKSRNSIRSAMGGRAWLLW